MPDPSPAAATPALAELGWNADWDNLFTAWRAENLVPARVAIEDKHHYVVFADGVMYTGQISGKFLHESASNTHLPKVGDWVAISPLPNEQKAVIHAILPRKTQLVRKVPGREVEEQILVTNVDVAFITQALDATFNLRRLERFLVMTREGGVKPVVVLNKADVCEDLESLLAQAQAVAGDATVLAASARTGKSIKALRAFIPVTHTAVFIGTSGVGKSSLINRMYGEAIQPTIEVRDSDRKGRHATTWREMIPLPSGGLVIDTPGMRELHLWMADESLGNAFVDLEELAVRCHFRGCSHTVEKRCALLEAVASGAIPRDRFDSYLKLKRESAELAALQARHGQIERKRKTRQAQRAFNDLKHGRHPGSAED